MLRHTSMCSRHKLGAWRQQKLLIAYAKKNNFFQRKVLRSKWALWLQWAATGGNVWPLTPAVLNLPLKMEAKNSAAVFCCQANRCFQENKANNEAANGALRGQDRSRWSPAGTCRQVCLKTALIESGAHAQCLPRMIIANSASEPAHLLLLSSLWTSLLFLSIAAGVCCGSESGCSGFNHRERWQVNAARQSRHYF